jgi:16S rRNA (uracil1498-N3)-methyltransferase
MRAAPRLFISADLQLGQAVQASTAQSHYLISVMRRMTGDDIVLFNGRDGEWRTRLMASGRACQLEPVEQLRPQAPEPDIWLLFAPLKRHAMELLVQKATELGVARLCPVLTRHTQAERINADRLQLIATEAAEQSERLTVPTLRPAQSLADVLSVWSIERALFVAAERCAAQLATAVTGPAALLIGPEGGFHAAELDGLRAHPFVHPVSLGPRILRAETAAIVGLALLLLSA